MPEGEVMTRRWYADLHDAKKGYPRKGNRIAFLHENNQGTHLVLCEGPFDAVSRSTWISFVSGLSASKIDRLALDWVLHGVSPTKNVKRGVDQPYTPVHIGHGKWQLVHRGRVLMQFVESGQDVAPFWRTYQAFKRAEGWASRVVRA